MSAEHQTHEACTHPWRFQVEPFRILDNVFYVGNRDVSAHLLDTGRGLILLDTAFPQTVYLLLESIRQLGFRPQDIAYILHTHGHYDHMGGTRALVELTGAKTFLGRADRDMLRDRPELSWAPEYGVEFHESFRVDRPLAGGEVVKLGDFAVECVPTPGHTAGAMSYFFTARDGGRECTVGLHGGPGLNTLSDDYLRRYRLPVSRRTSYLASLRRLKRRKVDVFLGIHPDQSDTLGKRAAMRPGLNPFIEPAAWPRFLETLQRQFQEQIPGRSGSP